MAKVKDKVHFIKLKKNSETIWKLYMNTNFIGVRNF